MLDEKDKQHRAELAEHEELARNMGLTLEDYVQGVIMPHHLSGGMPIQGLLRRSELWALDEKFGSNWWLR